MWGAVQNHLRLPCHDAELLGASALCERHIIHPDSNQGAMPLDPLRILVAIFLPPLGVFMQEGIGKHFWINILLTLLGYIPGIIHAVWIIAKR